MAENIAGTNIPKTLSVLLSLNPRILIEKGSQINVTFYGNRRKPFKGFFKICSFGLKHKRAGVILEYIVEENFIPRK
jgi:hypothetical protein